MTRSIPVLAAAALAGAVYTTPASTQGRSVWDGAYTDAQAERGRAAYKEHCAGCHMDDLMGFFSGGAATPIKGQMFQDNWDAASIGDLFEKIRTQMPREAADTVADAPKLDIMTYILKENGYPAGTTELKQDAQLMGGIVIQPKTGPKPLENGAIVQTVGCLSQSPDKTWILTNAVPLTKTRNGQPSTDAALQAAISRPLGSGTVRLLEVFPSPDAHKGRRIEAKGLYMTTPSDGINIISFTKIADTCAP